MNVIFYMYEIIFYDSVIFKGNHTLGLKYIQGNAILGLNYILGNNLYGEDLKQHLVKIKDSEERNAYILMERIFPWPQKNFLLKVGRDPGLRDVISELGIFGAYLG